MRAAAATRARCCVVAEEHDRHRAERGVRRDRDRERRVDARELLDAERVGQRVAARAAVGLGDRARRAGRAPPPGAARRAGSDRCASSSSATGPTTPSANPRTVSRNRRCSSERSRSTPGTIPAALRCAAWTTGSLARYADAIVRDGLQIGSGDVLAVHPEPIQRELAIALAEAGYRAGARYVDVLDVDPAHHARPRARRARGDARRPARLGRRAHARARARGRRHRLDRRQRGPAGARRRAARACGAPRRRPRRGCRPTAAPSGARDARFAVVAWPTPAWAAQVYPELTSEAAVASARRRPTALRPPRRGRSARAAGGGTRSALAARAERLTALDLREIRLRGAGHGSPPGAARAGRAGAGASSTCAAIGSRRTSPTEEVFTSPEPSATCRAVPLHAAARASRGA